MRIFKVAILIMVFASLGFMITKNSWNGVVYVESKYILRDRNPAAIRRDLDFSVYEASERLTASRKRLVEDARIIEKPEQIGIELGHFVTIGKDNHRVLACEFYNKITMQFEGEGVAESGEKPKMELDGACHTNLEDITRISAIWIPVKKITEGKPVDMDLAYPEMAGVQFRFQNMGSTWPKQWVLRSVRLYNEAETGMEIRIGHDELKEILKKPFVLNW